MWKTKKISIGNRLDLKTLGSRPILATFSQDAGGNSSLDPFARLPWSWCCGGTVVVEAGLVVEFSDAACMRQCTYPLIPI